MKRWVYLVHRWLGIALCWLMALWFVSGVVMMYVGYPKLTPGERLRALPRLVEDCCPVPPEEVFALAGPDARIQSLRLTSIGERAVYVATLPGQRYLTVDAGSGEALASVDAAQALRSAAPFAPGRTLAYEGVLAEDAWTHSKALAGHRPLHRLADNAGWLYYVSSASGEVVRDVSPVERSWGWVGAWLHWIYPLRGGSIDFAWSDLVIYSSLAGSLLALFGILIGLWRWRRAAYANGRHTPYRSAMLRWHHYLGLVGGLFVLTWVLSGLFSMNPWRMFDSGAPALRQSPLLAKELTGLSPAVALHRFGDAGQRSVELRWQPLAGQLYAVAYDAQGRQRLIRWQADGTVSPGHPLPLLAEAGRTMLPDARLVDELLQTEYDWHYFARAEHTMGGHLERPLPVLRLRFADPAGTWLYLDPASGRVVQRLDAHRRVQRVLFAFLHSWDWRFLLENRPLWDVLLIAASLLGLLLSASGAVIGWRRLRRRW
ncbi:PepSY domain-containing protein [Dechloromonas sp. ARDL1]|uniref:PepSY domain-containing protein n=1 Tax=Dechloromonas sp. ARDL1 TaxID=3322121 RepID=UPI003DA71582